MDLTPFVGDMPMDGATRRRVEHFINRLAPIITTPGRQTDAGWVWSAKMAALTAAVGDHAPMHLVTVRTVRDDGSAEHDRWVCHVACLVMRGTVDHVLRISDTAVAIIPLEEFYGMAGEPVPPWFACPYGDRQRCVCLAPRSP